ncbi:MAG: hypothetical protein JXQ73_21555 [Phycisphaerae bacterium]|nr:hypothetical protein [Phycisphaerae bacterium]
MLSPIKTLAGMGVVGLLASVVMAEGPKAPPRPPGPLAKVVPDDRGREMDKLREQIGALQKRRDELIDQKKLKEDDPQVRELSENIERLEREIQAAERGGRGREPGPGQGREREMDQIRQRLEALGRKRDELIGKRGLKEDHPQVREIGEQMEALERELRSLAGDRPGRERPLMGFGVRLPRPPAPELMEKLEAKMPETEFDNVSLQQVLEFLRDRAGINIVIEWRALGEFNVEQESEVTVDKMKNVPLEVVLERVLRSVEPQPGLLGHYIDGNVLVITSREAMPKMPIPPGSAEMMERLRRDEPELHDRLMTLSVKEPGQFREELARLRPPGGAGMGGRFGGVGRGRGPVMRPLDPEQRELMERDRQMTDRSIELAERVRRVKESPERKELMDQLRNLLSEHFDLRMQIRRIEVKDLEKRLGELTAGLEQRERRKQELVQKRLNQLLRPEESDW